MDQQRPPSPPTQRRPPGPPKRTPRAPSEHDRPSVAGESVEVAIERMIPGGLGIGFADGRTVFVPLSAPGDRLRVTLRGRRGNAVVGTISEVLLASPQRVDPPCPYFGRCGGCDFQQLGYEHQLAAKVETIADCLRRLGGLEYEADIPITPSPDPWRYRGTAEWQVDPPAGVVGYFGRDSHRVVDIDACPILEPDVNDALATVRAYAIDHPGGTPHEVRAMSGSDGISLYDARSLEAPASLTRVIGGETYHYDSRAFFQANPSLLEAVTEEVFAHLPSRGGRFRRGLALDLYSGIGLFTVPLARRFSRVIAIESDPISAAFAEQNLAAAGLSNVRVRQTRVERWLPPNAGHVGRADVVILDPPRVGAEAAIPAILRLEAANVVYVSCDPATLARDLKRLVAGGYELTRVAAFDMFPQTHHVEVVAHLTYNPPPPPLKIELVGG